MLDGRQNSERRSACPSVFMYQRLRLQKHIFIQYDSENINRLKASGHYMYRQFNIQQFYVLPTQCIYVFCVDLRTNSDYFPIQY